MYISHEDYLDIIFSLSSLYYLFIQVIIDKFFLKIISFWRRSPQKMQAGWLWDVFSVQGRSRTWHIGSSVSFEAFRSVTEYSNFMLKNMVPHDLSHHDYLQCQFQTQNNKKNLNSKHWRYFYLFQFTRNSLYHREFSACSFFHPKC